jgi:hypothetical protein
MKPRLEGGRVFALISWNFSCNSLYGAALLSNRQTVATNHRIAAVER